MSSLVCGQLTSIRPRPAALPSAVNGSVACRPPPRPLQVWLFQQPRPERQLHVRVPALSMTRPRSLRGYLLTNSFVTQLIRFENWRKTLFKEWLVVCYKPNEEAKNDTGNRSRRVFF